MTQEEQGDSKVPHDDRQAQVQPLFNQNQQPIGMKGKIPPGKSVVLNVPLQGGIILKFVVTVGEYLWQEDMTEFQIYTETVKDNISEIIIP